MFAYAIIAYQAYGEATMWKNFRGEDMPKWENLPPHICEAWRRAAEAVRNAD